MSQITMNDLKNSIRQYKKQSCPTFSGKKRGELESIVNKLGLNVKATGKAFGKKRAVKAAVELANRANPKKNTKQYNTAVDKAVAMAKKKLGM